MFKKYIIKIFFFIISIFIFFSCENKNDVKQISLSSLNNLKAVPMSYLTEIKEMLQTTSFQMVGNLNVVYQNQDFQRIDFYTQCNDKKIQKTINVYDDILKDICLADRIKNIPLNTIKKFFDNLKERNLLFPLNTFVSTPFFQDLTGIKIENTANQPHEKYEQKISFYFTKQKLDPELELFYTVLPNGIKGQITFKKILGFAVDTTRNIWIPRKIILDFGVKNKKKWYQITLEQKLNEFIESLTPQFFAKNQTNNLYQQILESPDKIILKVNEEGKKYHKKYYLTGIAEHTPWEKLEKLGIRTFIKDYTTYIFKGVINSNAGLNNSKIEIALIDTTHKNKFLWQEALYGKILKKNFIQQFNQELTAIDLTSKIQNSYPKKTFFLIQNFIEILQNSLEIPIRNEQEYTEKEYLIARLYSYYNNPQITAAFDNFFPDVNSLNLWLTAEADSYLKNEWKQILSLYFKMQFLTKHGYQISFSEFENFLHSKKTESPLYQKYKYFNWITHIALYTEQGFWGTFNPDTNKYYFFKNQEFLKLDKKDVPEKLQTIVSFNLDKISTLTL